MTRRGREHEKAQKAANVRLYAAYLKDPTQRPVDLAVQFGMTKSQATGAIWRRKTGCY